MFLPNRIEIGIFLKSKCMQNIFQYILYVFAGLIASKHYLELRLHLEEEWVLASHLFRLIVVVDFPLYSE